ncbi:MAG: nucleotidyl transferase AbiEii/AbiGii toxin family protein [Ginsengibacter sp.]
MLQYKVLNTTALDLLRKISDSPLFSEYRLVGGTALALQFGHRISIDLDFFGTQPISGIDMIEALSMFGTVQQTVKSPRVQSFFVNTIKVDVVHYPYEWIDFPVKNKIRIASIKDIAAMKLAAITNRGTKKDFVDLYLLLEHITLIEMMDLYSRKFPQSADFFVLRSLTYFEDADQNTDPEMLVPYNWNTIKETIIEEVSRIVT